MINFISETKPSFLGCKEIFNVSDNMCCRTINLYDYVILLD